jgi:hypothetical protein
VKQLSLLGANDHSERVLVVLREIVDVIGLKEAAFACDCSASLLCDALNGRNNKYVRICWALAIMEKAPRSLALTLRRALVGDGYGVTEPTLTPAEELARLKDLMLRRLGTTGESLIEEARR